MVSFCKKQNKKLLFVQLRKSAGKSWKKSWNFDAKSPGKSEKKSPGKSWNSKFFGGNHESCIIWDRLQNSLLILGEFKQIN